SLPVVGGRVRARAAARTATHRAGGLCAARLGIFAISAGRAFAHSIRRRRSGIGRAAGSDRGGRTLSLRAQPDVSRAPDFHAGLGVGGRFVVCAAPVRRSRALVSPPCARGRNAPAGKVWGGLPRLSAAGETLDPGSAVNGCRCPALELQTAPPP